MTALTAGKAIRTRSGAQISAPLKAATKVFAGGIACINASGLAVAASTATGLKCVGFFEVDADNSAGADGEVQASIFRGVALCANSAGADALALANVNDVCYLVDDQTVAKTNGGGTRSAAGRVVNVGTDGVWVALGEPGLSA